MLHCTSSNTRSDPTGCHDITKHLRIIQLNEPSAPPLLTEMVIDLACRDVAEIFF